MRPFAPKTIARPGRLAVAGLLALCAGCSEPSVFTRRTGMLGSLKQNVAQLESEKDGLARQLAEQKNENRRISNELAEVESRNGDLAARLDDARDVMARQGLAEGTRSASDDDRGSSRRTTPAGVPKKKRMPFAQIPSDRGDLDSPAARDDEERSRRSRRDEDDDQARLDDRSPWMPVARGANSPTRVVR